MNNRDWAAVMVDKKRIADLASAKLNRFTREEIVRFDANLRATDMARLIKILILHLGKEKTRELYEREIHNVFYNAGKDAAEKMGNPKDLNSFLDFWLVKTMDTIPFVQPISIFKMTSKKVVFGVTECVSAEAYLKIGDPEVIEVLKSRCCHDSAFAKGFNPDMKFKRTKFLLDGEDMCEFECEIE